MTRRTRRSVLAATGGVVGLLAGCGAAGTDEGERTDATTSRDSPRDATASEPTDSRTDAPSPTVRLEPTAPPGDGATVLVYPTDLRSWLRTAATEDRTLRAHATADVPAPNPPLSAYERVQLVDAAAEVEGRYELDATGGVRYEYVAGAAAVDPPAGAAVTPISELSPARRSLAAAAVAGDRDRARFHPETPLGEWVRTEFFGGYVRTDGTVYRGREVQRTDATVSSRECWYVLSLSLTGDGPTPSLSLALVGDAVRAALDELLAERDPREAVTRSATDFPRPAVRFLAETDYVLTHAAVLETSVRLGS